MKYSIHRQYVRDKAEQSAKAVFWAWAALAAWVAAIIFKSFV